jgi:L-Ala-D/L-Glu epimerase
MTLSYATYQLQFKHPFGVSSNTRTHTPVVFLKIELDGITGFGEACLPAYLGETENDTIDFLFKVKNILKISNSDFSIEQILSEMDLLSENNNAGKAAVDIALHDLKGKIENKPISELKDLNAPKNVFTSCTIGLDHADKIAAKIKEASDFKILKIKAGSENDKALINMIRSYTDKPLYIDVNQGWKDKYFVLDKLHYMHENKVILAEQPMPVCCIDDMAWVTARSPIPTIADENVKRLCDVEKINGAFTGINIKLMKSTGLTEAVKMVEAAKKNNLKIMLGCMAESSCATTAMAHLAAYADYTDLDAPNLIVNDPFSGISYHKGQIQVPLQHGIGIELRSDISFLKI